MLSHEIEKNQDVINIRTYVDILLKQKMFIIVFCLSAMLFSLGITYFISEKYETGTTIFYRPIEISLIRQKSTEAFGAPVPAPPFKVIIQTLRDAAKNEIVLRPVVKALRLDEALEMEYESRYQRWYYESKDYIKTKIIDLWTLLKYGKLIEEDPTVAAIIKLRKNMNITSTKDSYIYVLSVRDKFPKRAAMIVDAVGEGLENFLKGEYQNPTKWKLTQLTEQVTAKQQELSELRAQREEIFKGNRFISIPNETSEGLSNLYGMELEEINLSVQIEKKRKSIAELEAELRKGAKDYVQSEDFKKMKSDRLFQEIELKGLIAGRQHLRTSIARLKRELQELPALKTKMDEVETKIGSATRAHEHARDLCTELLTQVLTFQDGTQILNKAVVPDKPVQPIKVYHVGLSLLLSLGISTALAFLFDFLNIRTFVSTRSSKGFTKGPDGSSQLTGANLNPSHTERLLEDLSRQLDAKGGSLFLRKENHLELAHSLDRGHKPALIPFPLKSDSIFEHALRKRQPIITDDLIGKKDVRLSGRKGYQNESMIALPMIDASGEVVAMVSLHNKTSSPFTYDDKQKALTIWRTYLMGHQSMNEEDLTEIYAPSMRRTKLPSKGRKQFRLASLLLYSSIGVCGAVLSALGYYFLNKLGY